MKKYRKSNGNKPKGGNTASSDRSEDETTSTDGNVATQAPMAQDAIEQVGLARRSFLPRIREPESEPAVVLRIANPCEGTFAFGGDSLGQIALNTGHDAIRQMAHTFVDGADYTTDFTVHGLFRNFPDKTPTVLHPYSKLADHTLEVMWPVYHSLFQSSPRDATALSFAEFITIIGRTHFVYCTLLTLVNLMATTITAREDPDPFMNSMLTNLGVKMGLYKAVSKAELERVIRKVSFLPVIPGIAREANTQLSNFVNPFMPSGITIPVYGSVTGTAQSQNSILPADAFKKALALVDRVVDSLVGSYSDEMAYLKLFLPGTIGNSFVLVPGSTAVDPIRGVGYYNTPCQDGISVNRLVRNGRTDVSYPLGTGVGRVVVNAGKNENGLPYDLPVIDLVDYHILEPQSDFGCEDIVRGKSYASKVRPYYYSIMGDMIAGEMLNSTFHWDDGGISAVTRTNVLATPHFYGEMMLLCEEARDLEVWPFIDVTNTGVNVTVKNALELAAPNWFRKMGIRDITRQQAVASPTFYSGLKRCTPALRLMQIALLKHNTRLWQHDIVSAIDSAQGGKFVAQGSDLARETLK